MSVDRASAGDQVQPFAERVIRWQKVHGRHHLPWQNTDDPYRIWLSEVMLQQTQVATVLTYFDRFLQAFSTVKALADADIESVMTIWSGLGYYSRARNLHRCAQRVAFEMNGQFPADRLVLQTLPGIGRSTAAAIAVFAWGHREAILDGNVKRVFSRHQAIEGLPTASGPLKALWTFAESALPDTDLRAYTQGLMDLGATVCTRTRPSCGDCPLQATCRAWREGRTGELPTRRSRKPLDERRCTMLVLTRSTPVREVLLVQRPATGIWGGLLSLPESALPLEASVQAHLSASGLARLQVAEPPSTPAWIGVSLPAIDHAFSHFRLRIEPLHVELPADCHWDTAADTRWAGLDGVHAMALPGPVRKLLAALR